VRHQKGVGSGPAAQLGQKRERRTPRLKKPPETVAIAQLKSNYAGTYEEDRRLGSKVKQFGKQNI